MTMMTRDLFDQYCSQLKATTHVVQWEGASVWKVGGKIFAIAPSVLEGEFQPLSFKVSDLAFEVLTQQEGIVPSPYLARAKWVQLQSPEALTMDEIISYLTEAHELIASKLTKKLQKELGFL